VAHLLREPRGDGTVIAMPEPAEEIHARVVAAVGEDGHLPMPEIATWDVFPWEVVDGELVPKTLPPPADEPPRAGEQGRPCGACAGFDPARVVWEDERWVLTHEGAPSGLPLVLVLHTRRHVDLSDLDDELASELGRISVRLVRIIGHLPHIGRVHVNRWGDGGSHFHLWFFARPARLGSIRGSYAVEWDAVLPPGPEDTWRADLHTVATKLANWGGHARA
jgi:diadenosine tetraphosphate (Ap4A) HIT family hydrolase